MELGRKEMDEEVRKRYQLLKEKNQLKVKELNWKNNILFKECIDSLDECKVLSLEESEALFNQINDNFPMTSYGCIDWKSVKDCIEIEHISDIYNIFKNCYEYYILWDQKDIPCVSCKLATIIENIDDVLAVSFDTWLLSKDRKEIIEFYHEERIIYGKTEEC